MRRLVLVLGDQLDRASSAFEGLDAARDRVWMAELPEESQHVWSHKARTALFLSAMRHFAADLEARGIPLRYLRLGRHPYQGFADALDAELRSAAPERLIMLQPGDYRVLAEVRGAADRAGIPLEIREDRHFLITLALDDFQDWARDRKGLRLEHFYRFMRRRTGILMDGKEPAGGSWNYDRENRRSFGPYQDALWTGEPYLYHSRLSAALKLIAPRTLVEAAVAACERGDAPLASVEGFVRQVLGWRELVRGCTRATCLDTWRTTTSAPPTPCQGSTGPGRRRCAAWRRPSARPWSTAMRTTSSG